MNNIGAVKYIVVGAVIAIALIGFAVAYPLLSKPNTGLLALQITDPPIAPPGVTNVVIAYSDIYIHVAGAGIQSGWVKVAGAGTIDLMSVTSVSQTLASSTVPLGTYNGMRFNVTSATVTYNNTAYPATVPRGWIGVPFPRIGGVTVSSAADTGVVIDMAPTIVTTNENGNLHFMIMPVVRAYPVPGAFQKSYEQAGARESKSNQAFLIQYELQNAGQITIQNPVLHGTSLTLTVVNTGSTNVTLTHVFMIGPSQVSLQSGNVTFYGELKSYQIFAVLANKTLEIANNKTQMISQWQSGQLGYQLASGASVTLTYTNANGIALINQVVQNLQQAGALVTTTQNIIVGQAYGLAAGGFFDARAYATVTAT
jgi:hypothetical protein